ncbi:hypothetical protein GGR52DRAFT_374995 [Hypoxylon sp. FL1284]|nr:hypothetical protein GGR52DRAFT_374995 [Hypoxylon sp. FL1284]
MVRTSAAIASLFATLALASVEPRMGAILGPREDMLETRMEGGNGPLASRQAANGSDLTQWNMDTGAKCTKALSSLSIASNPSGAAVCYNLFSLNTDNGSFTADLHLYQVSDPSGDFLGIPPSEIAVGLQYSGATVSPVKGSDQPDVSKREDSKPPLLQAYMFIGQINADQMKQPMTMGVLEALVMPVVTLTGKNTAGREVSTNVSSNEAAFVNGIFSTEVVMSDFGIASLAVDNQTAMLHTGEVAFVLPGVNILIFPVGLVLTSIWLVVGVGFYGFGTYERYNYRDTYRRRKARADVSKPGYTARI